VNIQALRIAAPISIFVVLIGGLINVAQPLAGDQSLFFLGAKAMAHGATLYRDFWDLKQPGIYYFYLAAGLAGGFSPFAVHAFETAYQLVFAAVLIYATSRFATTARAATIVPLFGIAWCYLVTQYQQQLQVEGLAGFPLFLTAWLACEGTRSRDSSRRMLLFAGAGLAAGCALVLKLIFAPLVVALFAAAVLFPSRAYRPAAGTLAPALSAALAGAAIPLLATLLSFAPSGSIDEALTTWFKLPPRIVATLPHQSTDILLAGITWFCSAFAPLLVLAAAGLAGVTRRREWDGLTRGMLVWLIGGAATFAAQRTSWWEYQLLLLVVPLGVFAAIGAVDLWALLRASGTARERRTALAAALVLALAALPAARTTVGKVRLLASYAPRIRAGDLQGYWSEISAQYRAAYADAKLLPPSGGALYVMGDPIYYILTGRSQAIRTNGWALELLLPEQRLALVEELRAKSPRYLFITNDDTAGPPAMLRRTPRLSEFLARRYRLERRGAFGDLYVYSGFLASPAPSKARAGAALKE
jgi:hypothetical protein